MTVALCQVAVYSWVGDLPDKSGKYMTTVTEFGCIPVSSDYQTKEYGWLVTSFFNNVIGIEDPGKLTPPDFCQDAELNADSEEEPVDFFSVFLKKH
ncbi:hypothetical protein PFLUV_G00163430 [Perca fluviatilis]|uniref:Uncharacterized protein n=1 Tax=Perca fluviatilis TaxID=8168 RepID=A0A6A5EPV4_PERFL|nr:hypothetical protein PFLUV_G00163430 [Perca fluviatilis]